MEIKNPTSQAMYKVIKRLKPYAKEPVDMNEYIVTQCGTPHCIGGWYALACRAQGRDRTDFKNEPWVHTFAFFDSGVSAMAYDLGFNSRLALMEWTEDSEIFANDADAEYHLFHSKAFPDVKCVRDIIVYFEGVAQRLKAQETKHGKENNKQKGVLAWLFRSS